MIANRTQNLLILATALFIVGGLSVIPALDNNEANAASIREKLQKANDKVKKSFDRINKILNGHGDFNS